MMPKPEDLDVTHDGPAVLNRVAGFIGRYVAFPSPHCLTAVTLWAAHTHAVEAFYVTPRLVLDSPEPGSGKTRVLEVLNLLCRQPELMLSPTTAAIFRMLAEHPLTLLFDETDAIFDRRNAGNYEDLRALLNSGYKRGATIPRCVGDAAKLKVLRYKVFAPVALAGLAGDMPKTILTRAVVIHMRTRAPGERVEPYRERDAEVLAQPIRDALAAWMANQAEKLGEARPVMPDGVEDRPAEVWEALLAVADAAGGPWPERARDACRYFVLDSDPAEPSLGVRLLTDMKRIFGDADRMPTVDILAKLTALEEAPWGDMWGKPLDARRLSREMRKYGVEPATFDLLDGTGKKAKGYTTYATKGNVGLSDAWNRYLPKRPVRDGNDGNDGNRADQGGYRSDQVTDGSVTGQDRKPAVTSEVTQVTAVTQKSGCRVCGEPIDPAAGDIHPLCEDGERTLPW